MNRTYRRAVMGVLVGVGLAWAPHAWAQAPTSINLTVTNDCTVTWQWATQYLVKASSTGNGTVTGHTDDWVDLGSNAALTANADAHYHFVSWSGLPAGSPTSNATVNFTVDNWYTNIQAAFAIDVKTVTVYTAHGTAIPGTTNVPYNTSLSQSIAPEFVTNAPGVRVRARGVDVQGNSYTTP